LGSWSFDKAKTASRNHFGWLSLMTFNKSDIKTALLALVAAAAFIAAAVVSVAPTIQ
jgi:hypothetical protein